MTTITDIETEILAYAEEQVAAATAPLEDQIATAAAAAVTAADQLAAATTENTASAATIVDLQKQLQVATAAANGATTLPTLILGDTLLDHDLDNFVVVGFVETAGKVNLSRGLISPITALSPVVGPKALLRGVSKQTYGSAGSKYSKLILNGGARTYGDGGYWINGLEGGYFDATDLDIFNVVDGIRIDTPTAVGQLTNLLRVKAHDQTHYTWVYPQKGDGQASGDTHGDNCQLAAGLGGGTIIDCDFSGASNACIMISQGGGTSAGNTKIGAWLIKGNKLGLGGAAAINLANPSGLNDLAQISIVDNIITSRQGKTYEILVGAGVNAAGARNVRPDGSAVAVKGTLKLAA